MRTLGLHLVQPLARVPHRSCLAELDEAGRLTAIELLRSDEEIVGSLPAGPALVVVDAPLVVPNEDGQRDVERVLAWCDVPAFPASRRRLRSLYGGLRGVELLPALAAEGRAVRESLPEVVFRELLWEEEHPPDGPAMDVADYRAAWISVRPARFRPKGTGRALPAGLAPARALLAQRLDLGRWSPVADPDDLEGLDEAARTDAVACAYMAWRLVSAPERALEIGPAGPGRLVLPVDANLRGRLLLHLQTP